MSFRYMTNPASYTDGSRHTNPDPFVMSFLGKYYCYSTGEDGVNLSVSTDLVEWEYLGHCFQEPGRSSYWAPCVIYRNGIFYMYVSSRPAGAADPHLQRMRVATSSTPEGPFEFHSQMLDFFAIDADVVTGADGTTVMFYASNELTEEFSDHIGTSVVADVMPTPFTLAGDPQPVILPSLRQEMFEENRFGDGRDWFTIEGSTYFTHANRAFQTYSGNAYENPDYFVGVASAELEDSIKNMRWSKLPSDTVYAPLIRQSNAVEGTGHNSVCEGPNLIDLWICYHARNRHEERDRTIEQRELYIDRLVAADDELLTTAPTSGKRLAPELPTMFGTQTEQLGRKTLAKNLRDFSAEVYLRATPQPDAETRLEIELSGGAGSAAQFTLTEAGVRCTSGVAGTEELFSYPSRVALRSWQPFRIEKVGEEISLLLGELKIATIKCAMPDVPVDLSVSSTAGGELGPWRLTEFSIMSVEDLQKFGFVRDADRLDGGRKVAEVELPLTGRWRVEFLFHGKPTPEVKAQHAADGAYLIPGRNNYVVAFEGSGSLDAPIRAEVDLNTFKKCRVTKIYDDSKSNNIPEGEMQ